MVLMMLFGSVNGYVGPGAGFGIVTSFLVFLNALVVSLLSTLLWPALMAVRLWRRSRRESRSRAGRVVVLGLDGLSPVIARAMMQRGEMPALKRLAEEGTFSELNTTCPGISPVAWSSFMTGVNPGRHGIFDFLAPDRNRYIPLLSSVRTGTTRAERGIVPFRRTVMKPWVRLLRRSRPFWSHLGRYGIRSAVLRVPITYPPEPLDGHLLSGMCVPDVRGTQGSYTMMTERDPGRHLTGGRWCALERIGEGRWEARLSGPEREDGESAAVRLQLDISRSSRRLRVGAVRVDLEPGVLSEWAELVFRAGRKKVRGIARFCLTEKEDGSPVLYSTAVHMDPHSPSLPISHPVHYSRYLAGLYGPYATLGLAEDTWALSNGDISEGVFLRQTWSIFEERKRMFFDALAGRGTGLVVCVFDTSDRIQHMFWDTGEFEGAPVRDMYRRMDGLIDETLRKLRRNDMLIVMSDHGFTSFHTCIDFNRWLLENGYLVLEEGVGTVETSFRGVDWSRTRAWSMGLAGIMLNLKGRESQGTVEPGDGAEALLNEISDRLLRLEDEKGRRVINAVYRGREVYEGPYAGDGPDLVVGTAEGYRAGWGCVTGGVGDRVIYSNRKHWNGDHCHDHKLVPGTLAASRKLDASKASITDIAPTVLDALGISPPSYMEGRSLFPKGGEA